MIKDITCEEGAQEGQREAFARRKTGVPGKNPDRKA